jgi:uncharacterized repeat protein (TIGR03803 family)
MRSTEVRRRALQWICSLSALAALNGCNQDGIEGADPASTAPAAIYTVGGRASGLGSGSMLTLLDNGSDPLKITASGSFVFTSAVAGNAGYAVSVGMQPTGQTCTVTGGKGTIGTANVTNVVVTCSAQAYTLGGTIQGLSVAGLVLANGSDIVAVPLGAKSFTLPAAVAYGSSYNVTVKTQPTGLACTVNAGGGVMLAHTVTNIAVSCTVQYFTLGGIITGLGTNTGLVLMNGTDTLNVPANATGFTMATRIASGAHYNVTIEAQPPAGTCSVSKGSGIMAGAAVTNVAVACTNHVESVIHTFSGAPSDGANPWYGSLLLASDGNFYGTTAFGGTNHDGTVFKITPAGLETVLWSFGNSGDGSNPYSSLIQARDGNFYGTTNLGGLYGSGTVFKITPAGVETVLWSFGNSGDGANPYGSLIQGSDGNFYGMAYAAGTNQRYVGGLLQGGTVYKITPAGVETVLWSFGSGSDGATPYGKLISGSDGNFYGMTCAGGVNGKGTIFKITPAGAETVLWSFGGSGDGATALGNLTQGSDGSFYGMTYFGGANNAGVVFKMTPAGAETVLHSFDNTGDGWAPQGSLIKGTDGNFYGLTGHGGLEDAGSIFVITPSGTETVLYSFGAGPNASESDGQAPYGDLTVGSTGIFYGMTSFGGDNNLGNGTVFTFN